MKLHKKKKKKKKNPPARPYSRKAIEDNQTIYFLGLSCQKYNKNMSRYFSQKSYYVIKVNTSMVTGLK